MTIVVPRLSPESTTPLSLVSSNSSTVAPFSPEPLIVRPDVCFVMLSVWMLLSSAAAKSSPVGAVATVSTVTETADEPRLMLPAKSVTVAVTLNVPSPWALIVPDETARVALPAVISLPVRTCAIV